MLFLDNDNDISKKDTLYLSGIYAHGKLMKKLGYDILRTDEISLYNKIYNWHHEGDRFITKESIFDYEANMFEVKMYLWKNVDGKWIGLVCMDGDVDGNSDAYNKYNNRVERI